MPPFNLWSYGLTESQLKGYKFESWVVVQFCQLGFELLDWRSDKRVECFVPRSNQYPDLEFSLPGTVPGNYRRFAVECKWRQTFNDYTWKWIDSDQRLQYLIYSHNEKVPIYLAIGIGGEPDDPHMNYLIPFEAIESGSSITPKWANSYRWPLPSDLQTFIVAA